MEWSDVLDDATAKLESLGIRYVVVGSCASMIYGEVRFTRDVDILAEVQPKHVQIGGSEKHLRDIAGMLKLSRHPIDRDYVAQWAAKLDAMETWQLILDKVSD
jgi:hypothetical protein